MNTPLPTLARLRRMRKVLYVVAALAVLVAISALLPVFSRSRETAAMPAARGTAGEYRFFRTAGGGAPGATPAAAQPSHSGFEQKEESAAREAAPTAWPTGPMLIRTASLHLRVNDVAAAHEEIGRIARAVRGYVADTTLTAESGPASAIITIRIPSQGLDSVIERVAALGKLLQKQISAQEVTQEYVDLSSRRRNLEREEQRLLELLQRAGRVRDLLEVESTLARVRGEIETITGRLRYLDNQISLSTLTVQLDGPQPAPSTGAPAWTAVDVSRQAVRSLIGTGRALATMAIWIGAYTPVWLPILGLLVWAFRKGSRRVGDAS